MTLAKSDGAQVFAAWHNHGMVPKHADRSRNLIRHAANRPPAAPQASPKRRRLVRKVKR